MKAGGYSAKGEEDDRKSIEEKNPKAKKQDGTEEGNKEEYEPTKKGENSELVSEGYQHKVQDVMKDTTTQAHAAHLRHHMGKKEDELREKEMESKHGDKEFSTEGMPSTSY